MTARGGSRWTDPRVGDFIQEAMAVASTLLLWREGPQGEGDVVWEHNDREVWVRVAALLPKGNVALAAAAVPVGEPDDERLVEKVAELMRRQEGEHRGVQWNLPVYRKRARAVVAAVRGAGRENSE